MKSDLKLLIGMTLATVLIIAVGIILMGREGSQEKADNKILYNNIKASRGAEDAKATLVEFADFQCPACAVYSRIVDEVGKEYQDKVRIIYRHFPLDYHKNALPAAKTFEAAGAQGKYWEMYDLLYEKQAEWSEEKDIKKQNAGIRSNSSTGFGKI